jgi:hypothetical protein
LEPSLSSLRAKSRRAEEETPCLLKKPKVQYLLHTLGSHFDEYEDDGNKPSCSIKEEEFLDQLIVLLASKMDTAPSSYNFFIFVTH